MNDLKENKWLFIGTLIGLLFFGFLTLIMFKSTFKTDYIQIIPIIFGCFFCLITILCIVSVFGFFSKKDIVFTSWNKNKKKLRFLKYFPTFIAILFIVAPIIAYTNKDKQYNYVEITLTQINDSKIQISGKGSKSILIKSKEYPEYSFIINGVTLKEMDSDYYVNNVKRGDTLVVMIKEEFYNKKIAKTESLNFADKTINYQTIYVCGLKHRNFELFSTKDYEYARKTNFIWSVPFLIVVGLYFLYLQRKLCKEKKSTSNK